MRVGALFAGVAALGTVGIWEPRAALVLAGGLVGALTLAWCLNVADRARGVRR